MKTHALRLAPGLDLKRSLDALAQSKGLQAGCVLTCVGSLAQATLRLADQDHLSTFNGPFEIVALVGTFSVDGSHLHIAISDAEGKMLGGHLVEGCPIYTTAEIVVGELEGLRFTRPLDPRTGYDELLIEPVV